jgi:cytochrome c553
VSRATRALALGVLAWVAAGAARADDLRAGELLYQSTCAGCHGVNGTSMIATIPRLGAQVPSFLILQWSHFQWGVRADGPGHARMKNVGDAEMRAIAAFLHAQKSGPAWRIRDPAARKLGEKLYRLGDFERKIIACAVCHGVRAGGVDALTVPAVANQSPRYLVEITRVFQSPVDFHSAIGNGMKLAVMPLSDEDVRAVAEYLSSIGEGGE